MAFTYAGDPTASDLAMVRYLSGDTIDHSSYSASDAEVTATLARKSSNTALAAIEICEVLGARCASLVNTRNAGGLSVGAAERGRQYFATAQRLRRSAAHNSILAALPRVPAKDTAFIDERNDSTTETQPEFKIGMNDSPARSDDCDDGCC